MKLIYQATTVPSLLSLFLLFVVCHQATTNADDFELVDGDRVVLIGSEFIEQQIKHNFFETDLTLRWPDRNIQFRNLGWAGDTPTAIARGYFGGSKEGFRRLLQELDRLSPTVIVVCYGANSAPETFESDFVRLLGELEKRAKKIIVVSHPAAEQRATGFVDPMSANQTRSHAAQTLRKIVDAKNSPRLKFINLYSISQGLFNYWHTQDRMLTTDGIRFSEFGYQQLSEALVDAAFGVTKREHHISERWSGARALIASKNELYFHRYRPQNETYLRGFRKHEQGQNAKEIAEFDALIELAEKRIHSNAMNQPLPAGSIEPDPIKLTFEAFTPEQERESFTMSKGLNVSLFASEPMVANPIHMNFDSQGRLWVATSPIYPQIKPGATPSDEILILEDTNGDGRADKKTVFANDLLIPTAVLPDEMGGAYVANSTEILHLTDSDGDGVADQRRVVLAGFGTEDTHHIVHTFRWGPDAAVYFNQSIYIHSHLETPQGVKRLMGSGIWRFEPLTVDANVQMRGLINPWGHIFDEWGQSFATDGAGGDGINYAFPGSAYPTAVGFSQVLRGMNPGQPKLCGLEIITGRHYPAEWQNTLVTNDFRGNRINRFVLSAQGSGYVSKQLPDLMSSNHRAFRPVDVKMGPDGSLFVADWYNPIINHGEVDFRDSRRDYKHGRIWRVSVKGRPPLSSPDLTTASLKQLIETLRLPEIWNRHKARVEIKNRVRVTGQLPLTELATALEELLDSTNPRDQLEAIWTIEAVGQFDAVSMMKAMSSPDHRVRASAVRVLANQLNPDAEIQALVSAAATDEHPQVRLEFVNAWRKCCPPQQLEPLLAMLDHPTDQYIEFALRNALKDTQSHWIESLSTSSIANSPKKILFVLRAINSNRSVPLLFRLLNDGADPAQKLEIVQLISQRANATEMKQLFEMAVQDPGLSSPILSALVEVSKRRRMSIGVNPTELANLFDNPKAIRLAGEWKVEPLRKRVLDIATGTEATSIEKQSEAIRGIAAFGDASTLQSIAKSSEQTARIRTIAITQLAAKQPNDAAALAADLIATAGDESIGSAESLIDVFSKRKNGAKQLATRLARKTLSTTMKEALRKRAVAAGRGGKPLADMLAESNAGKMKTNLTDAEMKKLLEQVKTEGSPRRGETIYRRNELNCIKCHSIGGAGGVVGPDMISLGASSPMDYIVESLINPNAKIKEGYHTTVVLTEDGQQISGKLMSEADGKITLRDANDIQHVFDAEEIEERKTSTTSLMPADSVATLRESELIDLIAFLSALGKEGDYKVTSERPVRRWFTPDGKTVFARVDGSLPITDFEGKLVSFEIQVTEPGPVGFLVENENGLRITLNEMKDNLRAKKIVSDLPVGIHKFTFQVNDRNRRESLRVQQIEVEGSTAHAVIRNQ